ncbi:membrane hypothetical protein [Magnetospirillum sp. SS-4]|nr:membrane hypothetical protein [Magnetospirillum sp. SS-4]
MPRCDWRENATGAALAVFLALVQLRLILLVLGDGYNDSVEAAFGVTIGQPHWREVQNRVLAPYLVQGLSHLFADYFLAHIAFSALALSIAGFLAFRLGRRHGGGMIPGLLCLFTLQASFSFLLSPPWLYAWDYIEIITFILFAEFVLSGRPWTWFMALFPLALLNRESAFYISMWMILDPWCRWGLGRLGLGPATAPDRARILAGLLSIPAGIGAVLSLRALLFVEASGPRLSSDAQAIHDQQFDSMLINLFPNLDDIAFEIANPALSMKLLYPVFVVAITAIALVLAWRFPVRLLAFGLVHLVMVAGAMVVGKFFETRIFIGFIPLLLVAVLLLPGRTARECPFRNSKGAPGRERLSGPRDARLQLAGHGGEGAGQVGADGAHHGDGGDGDQGGDQAVFDGGGALFVTNQLADQAAGIGQHGFHSLVGRPDAGSPSDLRQEILGFFFPPRVS